MNLFPSSDREFISLRYTVSLYVVTYVSALVLTFVLLGFEADSTAIGLVGNSLSLLLFLGAMFLVERHRFLCFLKTRPVGVMSFGMVWVWLILAVPLGFALRLAGDAIFVVFEADKAFAEFNELVETNYAKVGDITLVSVAGMLVGAVTEEFIDRRIILPQLVGRLGLVGGVLCGGAFFGIMHFGYLAIFIGVFLSLVYLASGRTWVCVLVHLAGNSFYPLARAFELVVDWETYRLLSVGMLAVILVVGGGLFCMCRGHYPVWKPARDAGFPERI